MRKLDSEIVKSSFGEILAICEKEDIELVDASVVDKVATDSLDAINILTMRIFNDILDRDALDKELSKLNDPEYATVETKYIGDVLFIFVYI